MKKKKLNLGFKGEMNCLKKLFTNMCKDLIIWNLDRKGKLNAKEMWNIERNLVQRNFLIRTQLIFKKGVNH